MTTTPEPFDPRCSRYARDMVELDNFWPDSREDYESTPESERPTRRRDYVLAEEGTLNSENGHFLCDQCYIEAGMPSSNYGWICP